MYGHFADVYDLLMRDVDYDAWAAYVYALLCQNAGTEPPFDVLDCACGTGSVTLRLASMGCRAAGSDLSADMLRVCSDKARRLGFRIPLIRQDMRFLELHRPVDAVCCCCDGVNYLTSRQDLEAFFVSAGNCLRPGGLLLFDVSTPYKMERVLSGNTFGQNTPDASYLWQNSYDPATRLCAMELTLFIRRGELFGRTRETHVQRGHSREELQESLKKAGFTVLGEYEAFTRQPPRADSQRIQYAAKRNEERP